MKIKSLWPLFLFLAAVAVCTVVFIDVLPLMSVLQAPDAAPTAAKTSLLHRMLPWMSGTASCITHDDLLKVLPLLAYHELSFIVSTGLLALAMGVYLRFIGLPIIACFAGGLALAFSGYHFTLFNAGHRGYFIMMPYAVFMFALVECCLRRPRWFHFALIPFCAICGLSTQPDVFAMIIMVLAVYAVFRFLSIASEIGFVTYWVTTWKKLLFGIAILLVTFVIVGYNTVHQFLTVTMASRDQQLSQLMPSAPTHSADKKTAEQIKAEKHAQWIFATNWSLPPEAMAEFIAPCLRGLDTHNPKGPYWGRLGRTENWEQTKQGFANFRQHTLYLGALQCAFALYAVITAVVCLFGRRKGPQDDSAPSRDPLNSLSLFWFAILVVSILLAFGRYAPFYKLFYAIPFMDKIRAPVKFVHIAEIATSILFAIGIMRLLSSAVTEENKKLRLAGRITMVILVLTAAVCLGAGLAFNIKTHTSMWTAMGIPAGPIQSTLAALYQGALMRTAWLLVIAAVALGMMSFAEARKKATLAGASVLLIMVASVFDMAEIGRRYVVVQDVSYKFAPNPVLESVQKQGPMDGLSYSYLQFTNQLLPNDIPFMDTLSVAGLLCMDPTVSDNQESIRIKSYLAFQDDILKRWKYWGAHVVFAQPKVAAEMARANLVKVISLYDLDPQMRLVTPPVLKTAQVAVVEPLGMIPSVAVYHGWGVADEADALEALAARDFDFEKHIVISGKGVESHDATDKYTAATWVTTPLETAGNKAVIQVATDKPGMLFMRENKMRSVKLTATVNDKVAPVYKANGLFTAVPVEAGESTVVIRPYLSATSIVGTITALVFAILALVSFTRFEMKLAKGK